MRGVYHGRYSLEGLKESCLGEDDVNVYVNTAAPKIAEFVRDVVDPLGHFNHIQG